MILCILISLFIVALGMLCYMHFYAIRQLRINKITLHGNLSKPIRIVQFSDTHFKAGYADPEAKRIVELINQQAPDIIVFTGDLMDHYAKMTSLKESLPPILKGLQENIVKLAVYGNHDIGGQAKYVYKEVMEKSGFRVLLNDTYCNPEYDIAFFGIDDARLGYSDIQLCNKQLQAYQVLLSHEPDIIDQMDIHRVSLVLCGHTHGGQVALPVLRNIILPKGGQNYRKGLYQKQDTRIFVSSGIGTTKLPIRLFNPPEIVVIDID